MKHHLSFSVFLLLLLVLQSSGLECGPMQYPSDDNVKCCSKCQPGYGMKTRCTKDADTLCQPCDEGSYNSEYTVWPCTSCTFCVSASGFREKTKCESQSNAVCECLPGYKTVHAGSNEKSCDPCPPGHFAKAGATKCTPWTNCTTTGRNTFHVGTKEEDAVCGNPPMVPRTTEHPVRHSPKKETAHATFVTKPTSTSSVSTALSTEDPSSGVKSAYLSYILIAAALLLLLGGIILLKVFRKTKTYKEPGRFVERMQKDGKNSFRFPIQEVQIDTKSSLVQN